MTPNELIETQEPLWIYDTTLRDGAQREGLSLSTEDKLRIARQLDRLGIPFIEGGWPGANPKDVQFFWQLQEEPLSQAEVVAFCSTRRPGRTAANDPTLQPILAAGTRWITLFGKSWDLHVTEGLQTTLEENLEMIRDTIAFFRSQDRRVIYDAEHWFDGYKFNPAYALKTLAAAIDGGAEWLVLCDTNGGTLPHEVSAIVQDVVQFVEGRGQEARMKDESGRMNQEAKRKDESGRMNRDPLHPSSLIPHPSSLIPHPSSLIPHPSSLIPHPSSLIPHSSSFPQIGIHTHNDSGTAVANALAAVMAGATMVQGTVNGYGERCGNANLCTLIPNLQLKLGYDCIPADRLVQLTASSRLISEVVNLAPDDHAPFVGLSAFAHKGGIHVSAVERNPLTYEHIRPEQIGNRRRIVISDQSGLSNVLAKARSFGIELDKQNPTCRQILQHLKTLENQGYQFEAAEASFELLMREALGQRSVFFEIKEFHIHCDVIRGSDVWRGRSLATIKIAVEGQDILEAAEGNGPVAALDAALRKALTNFYPEIASFYLTDYKVRILDGAAGTSAKTRVLVESSNGYRRWTTVGVSGNIIDASYQAVVEGLEYGLLLQNQVMCAITIASTGDR